MAQTYLTNTNPTAGNRTKGTISVWVKRSGLSSNQHIYTEFNDGNNFGALRFNSNDSLGFFSYNSGSAQIDINTNRRFRDTNGWYHIVVAWDTTDGTSTDRVKIYINGVRETSFSGSPTYPSSSQNLMFSQGSTYYPIVIGRRGDNAEYFDGSMSHFHRVDNQQLAQTVFGETDSTTGEWKIKTSPSITYTGSSDFNFFVLKDGNSVTDQSGQGNNLTVGYGTLSKTEDCPSNIFCTANPLSSGNSEAFNGNTNIFFDDTGQWRAMYSTLGASSGKFYMEAKVDAVGGEASIGVIPADRASLNQDTGDYLGKETDSIGYLNNGRIFKSNSQLETGLASMSSGTIVGISLNLDANTVQFYNNDSAVGSAVSLNADTTYLFGFSGYSDTRFYANFGNGYFHTTAVSSAGTNASGNGIFEYDVKPSDATALSTKGLNL
nr:spry domain protein [uncultured Mediterranean phage uvMED]